MSFYSRENYDDHLKNILATSRSFKAIREFNIEHFPADGYRRLHASLQNGVAVLETPEQLNAYMACYSDIHACKLEHALEQLFTETALHFNALEVIDWGCGQAFASCVLLDYLQNREIKNTPVRFTLIDSSQASLERGVTHLRAILPGDMEPEIVRVNEDLNLIKPTRVITDDHTIKIHLLSNVLDIAGIDLPHLAGVIASSSKGINYFVCVSPLGELRLERFLTCFPSAHVLSKRNGSILCSIFRPSLMKRISKLISRREIIFKTIK